MRYLISVSFFALALGIFSSAGLAQFTTQPSCSNRDRVVKHLGQKYSEVQRAVAVTSAGGLIEVFRSTEDDNWTIILSMPNGQSCLIAAGEGWKDLPEVPLDPKI